jgi:hypothetical protein
MNRADFLKSLVAIGLVPPTLGDRWIAEAEAADESRPLEGAFTVEIDRHRIVPISIEFQADPIEVTTGDDIGSSFMPGPSSIVLEVVDVDAVRLQPAYLAAKVVEMQIDVGGARLLANVVVTELRRSVAADGLVGPATVVLAAVGEAIVEQTA